jgi:hypothetical protein
MYRLNAAVRVGNDTFPVDRYVERVAQRDGVEEYQVGDWGGYFYGSGHEDCDERRWDPE